MDDEEKEKAISRVENYLRMFVMMEEKANKILSRADDFNNCILNTPIQSRDYDDLERAFAQVVDHYTTTHHSVDYLHFKSERKINDKNAEQFHVTEFEKEYVARMLENAFEDDDQFIYKMENFSQTLLLDETWTALKYLLQTVEINFEHPNFDDELKKISSLKNSKIQMQDGRLIYMNSVQSNGPQIFLFYDHEKRMLNLKRRKEYEVDKIRASKSQYSCMQQFSQFVEVLFGDSWDQYDFNRIVLLLLVLVHKYIQNVQNSCFYCKNIFDEDLHHANLLFADYIRNNDYKDEFTNLPIKWCYFHYSCFQELRKK